MDLSPWLIRRQTYEAVADGRPDDAHRLLAPLLEGGNWKAWRAAREVVKGYCARATKAVDHDSPDAAWRDLLAAEALNTGERCVADLRQTLTRFGLVHARSALEAGDPRAAAAVAVKLRERGVRHRDLPPVEEAARAWLAAADKADRGDFLPALDDLHEMRAKLPAPPTGLDRYRDAVKARHARLLDAFARAQDATAARRWADAVAAADEALAAAPEYHLARTLRTRAWHAAYPGGDPAGTLPPDAPPFPSQPGPAATAAPDATPPDQTVDYRGPLLLSAGPSRRPEFAARETVTGIPGDDRVSPVPLAGSSAGGPGGSDRSPIPKRFLLWVDGVAGFLVCTGPRVTFGQATAGGGPVDVPLFADVSRVHAELSRDDEGYVIESGRAVAGGKDVARTVLVNGREVARSPLAADDRVTLGATCQFVFRRPVPVSSTARLELTSGHRLTIPVEAVLLMANEVILGPPGAHVPIPGESGRVLLYRSRDGIGLKAGGGTVLVNGRPAADHAALPLPANVETDTLTFTVEPVGPRL